MPEDPFYLHEPARDPSGERGRAFFEAAFERERWSALRAVVVGGLAVLSVPLWLATAWPGLLGGLTRVALGAWAMVAALFALAVVTEHRLKRVLARYEVSEAELAPLLEHDAALALLHEGLALATDPESVTLTGAQVAARALRARAVVLVATDAGLVPVAMAPSGTLLSEDELAAARRSLGLGRAGGLGVDATTSSSCLCVPIKVGEHAQRVLVIVPEAPVPFRRDGARLVAAIAQETARALERVTDARAHGTVNLLS